MPESRRKSLPDNLDPLVDTLSNVVGILIVVVILTQIQVGDALDRLIEIDASTLPESKQIANVVEAEYNDLSTRLTESKRRREAVLSRSTGSLSDAVSAAERALVSLEDMPKSFATSSPASKISTEREIKELKKELQIQRTSLEGRSEYASEIQQVPKELVARLPDPGLVTGEEAWILCRYQRCYLTDRTELIQVGSRAIGDIIGESRRIRPDEFDALAHHLRKRDIGYGNFRWHFVSEPSPRAQVAWRSKDPGIERTRLATSPRFAEWLAARSPERDFIRFQVWNDSFETYLEARQVIEAAGFRAGWDAFKADQELELSLTFGKPPPREGPVEVD